jgi:integrase
MDVPALHLVIGDEADVPDNSPTMMEAVETYLRLKAKKQTPTFIRAAKRNGRYVAEALGNRPITSYSSSDAAAFRDHLFDKGLSLGSVKRIFGSVRSIINLVMREHGIEGSNAFAKTYMPDRDDSQDRQPVPQDKLIILQKACQETDDEMRWLLALISDTGMRLSEAAGLHRDDIVLDAPAPHINLTAHPWRRLKTKSSARHIPLVGTALWAAKRLIQHDSSYAFPRYCDGKTCNANSASAALNKWMKTIIGGDYVVHGLRHSLRDRLRAVECPSDVIDQIGGWTTTGIGHAYGRGYSVEILAKWMQKIECRDLLSHTFYNHKISVRTFLSDSFCGLILFTMVKSICSFFALKLNHHNNATYIAFKSVSTWTTGKNFTTIFFDRWPCHARKLFKLVLVRDPDVCNYITFSHCTPPNIGY